MVPGGKPGCVEEIASNKASASACQALGGPATWTFQSAIQLGKTAMIDAISGTRAVTVGAPAYRTQVAKPQRRHSPIVHLAGTMLAAAAGIGFNVFVVMTLLL